MAGTAQTTELQGWHRAKEAASRHNRNLLQYAAAIVAVLGIQGGSGGIFAVAIALSKAGEKTGEIEALLKTGEIEALLKTEEIEALLKTAEMAALLKTAEIEALLKTGEIEALLQTREIEALLQTREIAALLEVAERAGEMAGLIPDWAMWVLVGIGIAGAVIVALLATLLIRALLYRQRAERQADGHRHNLIDIDPTLFPLEKE